MIADLLAGSIVMTLGVAAASLATFASLVGIRLLQQQAAAPADPPDSTPRGSESTQRSSSSSAAPDTPWPELAAFVGKAYLILLVICKLYLLTGLVASLAVLPATAVCRRDKSFRSMLAPLGSPLDGFVLFVLLPAAAVYLFGGFFWRACPHSSPLAGVAALATLYLLADALGAAAPLPSRVGLPPLDRHLAAGAAHGGPLVLRWGPTLASLAAEAAAASASLARAVAVALIQLRWNFHGIML
ncbi:hypothetical protein EMIHUDRAFT_227962 [Emiliania huxleyi CCMP1516]|uniref:Uncharacterized protein n=2 Tax=Emiliania huxleyi TaxID=2903 RepID=A0A0D3KGR2_EMIH1|nr:hypothetical protein EMIHUDRAFT_227962 [Emiliania huxleyi CCMP1516]EOD34947.1 hypothetical protein EMIHUDRAFT_227962 [Emiliania huxleyi CCMP1516]|eukprot:XP_005787376.1 hypothetical protein EMIHUDRAFT_227962 [Emiliania huxleyi CCMP1516]